MLKRLLVAAAVFFALVLVWHMPTIIIMYRTFSRERVFGFAFVLGSPLENVVRVVILLLSAMIAFWISGRLIKVP